MRYVLKNGALRPVAFVTKNGLVISNPPDSLVDELKAGWPLIVDPQPEYDLETQRLSPYYGFSGGAIHKKWEVEAIDPEPDGGELEGRVEALEKENEALRAALESAME